MSSSAKQRKFSHAKEVKAIDKNRCDVQKECFNQEKESKGNANLKWGKVLFFQMRKNEEKNVER